MASIQLRPGVELAGRYVVSDVIGSGGFGIVWKAADKQLGRLVALKRLLDKGLPTGDEILGEARRSASLVHQNIVQIYDIIEDDDHIIVMEYVDGPSLHSTLRAAALEGSRLPVDEVGGMLRGILHGVSHAHQKSICHRDLSPLNILIASDGTPKIADFGIARELKGETSREAKEVAPQGGTGNPEFMSPEQARGEPADFSSDLFMVGIVAYLLLSGRHPFSHPSGLFQIAELLQDEDYLPPQLRVPASLSKPEQLLFREFAALTERLLRRERSARFSSAVDVIARLEAATPGVECVDCGSTVATGFRFCGNCGRSIDEDAVEISALGEEPSADDLVRLGFEASRLKDWDASIRHYRDALRIDADCQKAYASLGYALNHLGQYEEATEVLSKGLDLGVSKPEHEANFRYMRGFAMRRLKRYEEALEDLGRAVELQPRLVRGWFQRAQVLMQVGKSSEAREDLEKVVKLEPAHEGAQAVLQRLGL